MTSLPTETVHIGDEPTDEPRRRQLLHILSQMPSFVKAVQKLGSGDMFRVVMSAEHADLFKKAADGFYKPYLHDGKRFVGNVDLMRVPPNYMEVVSDVALMANMAVIAAKLEAIEVGIRNIGVLIANTQRGKVQGTLDALALAGRLSDPSERRGQMISACRDVVSETRALIGQLKSHIAAMPMETTGLFDGILGNGIDKAKQAYREVEDDAVLLIQGVGALLRAYQELGEPAVAKEAVARIVAGLKEVLLEDAIRKSRLIPFPEQGVAPELMLRSFRDAVTTMDARLLSGDHADKALLSLDIKAEELQG